MNELYYFFRALGDPFDRTQTYKLIKRFAREQATQRNRVGEPVLDL